MVECVDSKVPDADGHLNAAAPKFRNCYASIADDEIDNLKESSHGDWEIGYLIWALAELERRESIDCRDSLDQLFNSIWNELEANPSGWAYNSKDRNTAHSDSSSVIARAIFEYQRIQGDSQRLEVIEKILLDFLKQDDNQMVFYTLKRNGDSLTGNVPLGRTVPRFYMLNHALARVRQELASGDKLIQDFRNEEMSLSDYGVTSRQLLAICEIAEYWDASSYFDAKILSSTLENDQSVYTDKDEKLFYKCWRLRTLAILYRNASDVMRNAKLVQAGTKLTIDIFPPNATDHYLRFEIGKRVYFDLPRDCFTKIPGGPEFAYQFELPVKLAAMFNAIEEGTQISVQLFDNGTGIGPSIDLIREPPLP